MKAAAKLSLVCVIVISLMSTTAGNAKDGDLDYVEVAHDDTLDITKELSIVAWAKFDEVPVRENVLLDKGPKAGIAQFYLGVASIMLLLTCGVTVRAADVTLVAGTAGRARAAQIWVSTDGGETWTLKKDLSKESPPQRVIFALGFDSQHNTLVAGTQSLTGNGQLWASRDYGETWTLKKDLSRCYMRVLTFDSHHNTLVAGTAGDGQIWVSSDGGETWILKKDFSQEQPKQHDLRTLAFDSHNERLVAGTIPNAQIWVSSDGGETWTLKKDLSKESSPQDQVCALTFDSQNNRLVAGTHPNAQIWVSSDGGETWTLKKDLSKESPSQPRIYSLTFDSQNNRLVVGTGYNEAQIWVSADSGETWALKKDLSEESLPQECTYSLTYDSQNKRLIAGTHPNAQIWVSSDGGETWTLKKDISKGSSPPRIGVFSLTAMVTQTNQPPAAVLRANN